jgi:hypothetical protein
MPSLRCALIENNGIDLKSFSRGTFPNHLISIRDGKFNLRTRPFMSLMILPSIKRPKIALIENLIQVNPNSGNDL